MLIYFFIFKVWNLLDGSPISLFCGHQPQSRLFCTEWSLHDEDLVFTAGDDAMCIAWRPSENIYKQNKGIVKISVLVLFPLMDPNNNIK